jgi:sulfatase maturation enzyme AslB (radical SAM superfamily)
MPNSKDTKTFCILPWRHLFISELGHAYPCCLAPESSDPIKNEREETLQVQKLKNPADEVLNSSAMKKIRLQMIAGEKPKPCTRCFQLEDAGLISHRQGSNHSHQAQLDQEIARTKADGEIEVQLQSMDLRLGNTCNLRCRMCSPFSSKLLIKEFSELEPEKTLFYQSLKNIDWFQKPVLSQLMDSSKEMQSLHFAGGEPLIIKEHLEALEALIKNNRASQIELSYNTNITFLDDQVLSCWKHFKSVSLMISLDGFRELNHYIRFSSNWAQIEANIQNLKNHRDQIKLERCSVNVTVQAYNIFGLAPLLEFLIHEKDLFPRVNLSPLFYPQELSFQVLPKDLKQIAARRLRDFVQNLLASHSGDSGYFQSLSSSIESILKLLEEKDLSHLFPAFQKRTRLFDKSRNQRISELIPEFKNF